MQAEAKTARERAQEAFARRIEEGERALANIIRLAEQSGEPRGECWVIADPSRGQAGASETARGIISLIPNGGPFAPAVRVTFADGTGFRTYDLRDVRSIVAAPPEAQEVTHG